MGVRSGPPIAAGDALRTWLRATCEHLCAAHARAGTPPARDCPRCKDLIAYLWAARAHYGDELLARPARADLRRGRLLAVLDALGVLPPVGGRA